MAFDVVCLNGRDLRNLQLSKRKALLLRTLPQRDTRVRYVDYVVTRGRRFLRSGLQARPRGHSHSREVVEWNVSEPRIYIVGEDSESQVLAVGRTARSGSQDNWRPQRA